MIIVVNDKRNISYKLLNTIQLQYSNHTTVPTVWLLLKGRVKGGWIDVFIKLKNFCWN